MKSETFPTVSDVLKRARVLISRGWCQGTLARTADGENTGFEDRTATQFCAVGAIYRASYDLGVGWEGRFVEASERLEGVVPKGAIVTWNNAPERTKEEVLAAFDQAAGAK